jgi:Family of unknown function (DUF5994)
MTLQPEHPAAGWKQQPPENTPRLRLKPKEPRATGYVDGAWWPHTGDLATELPDLMAVLSVRLGPIDAVSYNLDEWAEVPKKVLSGRRVVRLAGYHRQPLNTIELRGMSRNRVVLLVVPPQTDPAHAHAVMMAAAKRDDATTTNGLLEATTPG